MRWGLIAICCVIISGCSTKPPAQATAKSAGKKLGIRPHGDETIQPDLSKTPDDLKKVYSYIDEHIDEHVENLQKWIRQPSISNTGEGIPESAEMVKGFFDQLGCQTTRVYDVGVTEYGSPGNPVVYAKCDEGAPKTLAVYWMYDTMPITQPDVWKNPPFEARLVEQSPFKKVLIGRGATNSKGPEMVQWNAVMAHEERAGQAARQPDFHCRGRRGAHGYRTAQVREGSSRPGESGCDAHVRPAAAFGRGRSFGRIGRLRQFRADHQRKGVGPRSHRFRHSRQRTNAKWIVRRGGISRCSRRW